MKRWIGCMTDVGDDLIAKSLDGEKITICAATFGTGTVDVDKLREQTELVEEKQAASIVANNAIAGGRKIGVQIRAHTEMYTVNQIGFWGKSENMDGVVLVAIYQYEKGIEIPSIEDFPDYLFTFYGIIVLKNDAQISVTIDQNACVSREALEKALEAFREGFSGSFEEYKKEVDDIVSKTLQRSFAAQDEPPKEHNIWWVDTSDGGKVKYWNEETQSWTVAISSGAGGFVVQDSPPDEHDIGWVDTSVGGVMKYWNGNDWTPTLAVWG